MTSSTANTGGIQPDGVLTPADLQPNADRQAPAYPTTASITLTHLAEQDAAGVLDLHHIVFGPGRFARTAFRLRETATPLSAYSFVARKDGDLVGAVSMSRITVGTVPGALLGPLAVRRSLRDVGIGKMLLMAAVDAAFAGQEPYVLLVGDLPYYAAAGFVRVPFGQVIMPGPVDPLRLLVARNPDPSATTNIPQGEARGI
ncbi:MAG: N-acetyltransferase [Pseudomonadota bacterium]